MKINEILNEETTKIASFAFGRMNPPTVGHKKLADVVAAQKGDGYIFLSHSSGSKTKKPGSSGYENKDPLSFNDKVKFAQMSFPNVKVGDTQVKTVMQAMQKLEAMGYTDIIFVAGSDRLSEFETLLKNYNGSEYNFNSINIVSAGQRDPDAEGAEGMSASKMRAAVRAGDYDAFSKGAASSAIAKTMYDTLRSILSQNPMPGDNFGNEESN